MKGMKGGPMGKIGKAAGVAPTKNKGAVAPRKAGKAAAGPTATSPRFQPQRKK